MNPPQTHGLVLSRPRDFICALTPAGDGGEDPAGSPSAQADGPRRGSCSLLTASTGAGAGATSETEQSPRPREAVASESDAMEAAGG